MTETEARPGRRRRLGLALAILAAGFLSVVVLVITRPAPARATVDRADPRVRAVELTPRSGMITVEGTGTIRPRAEITLSPQVAGEVVRVSPAFTSGGAFARGDVLLTLDDAPYRNAVASAQADVAQRRVDVALALQEQTLAVEEYRLLRAREGLTEAADTSLAARLARREPQLEAARAALARAEALLADAQLNLDRTVIRAPFNGRIRTESVDVGQYVSPGQALAQLYDVDEAEMVVSLSPSESALIDGLWERRAGDPSRRIGAVVRWEFGGTTYAREGYLDRAEGALDATTRTVDVVVRVPEPFRTGGEPPLLIGSYARAEVDAREMDAFYALPRTALRADDTIWLVGADATLSAVDVRVFQEREDTVYFTADLDAGTRVVVSDLTFFAPDMRVSVDEAGAS